MGFFSTQYACCNIITNSLYLSRYKFFSILGVIDEVLLEARLLERKSDYEFQKNEQWINGNDNYLLQMHEHFAPDQSKVKYLF